MNQNKIYCNLTNRYLESDIAIINALNKNKFKQTAYSMGTCIEFYWSLFKGNIIVGKE